MVFHCFLMVRLAVCCDVSLVCVAAVAAAAYAAGELDLTKAMVVVRSGELPAAEKMAATVLVEETVRAVHPRIGHLWREKRQARPHVGRA